MRASQEDLACLGYNGTEERLSCLNNVKAMLYLPVTIFLAVLIVVGTLGNITVCMVYWNRTSRMSSHYFILALAILDLMTCVVGMPTEVADLTLPYTFRSPMACKVLRFIHSTTIIASSTILIQVAFDRYYRICQLGRQFTAGKARMLCFGAFMLGIICSWPSVILFGRKTVTIRLGGVVLHGEDCSTDDSMRGTIYPMIYYAFLFSLFGMTVTFFGVLYSKIGLTILSRKRLGMGHGRGGSASGPHGGAGHKGSWRAKKMKAPLSHSSEFSSGHECEQGNSTASSSISQNSSSGCSDDSCYRNKKAGASKSCYTSPTKTNCRHSAEVVDETCNRTRHKSQEAKRSSHILKLPDETKKSRTLPRSGDRSSSNSNSQRREQESRSSGAGPVPHLQKTFMTSSSTALASIMIESLKGPGKCHPKADVGPDSPRSPTSPKQKIRAFFFQFQHQTHQQEITIGQEGAQNTETGKDCRKCRTPKVYRKHHSPQAEHETKDLIHPRHVPSGRQFRVGKTTTVLFAVTLAYILSFLPYLIVMVMRSIIKDLETSLSPTGELAYKFCVKSFFINNAINPLIYSFLNQGFRQDARNRLARLCGRRNNLPRG